MVYQEFCRDCEQKHNCQEVYRQLGKAKGPSVVCKAVAAFLLPIVVFIVSLIAFDKILAGITDTKGQRTLFSFLLALAVTFGCILVIKVIGRRFNKN